MKAIVMIMVLGLAGYATNAQTSPTPKKSNYPYHTISKEVQKLQFKNVEHMPAKITLVSPALTQSKGTVQLMESRENTERVLVRVGYPAWTISKDVARRQYEKSQVR